MKPEPIDIPETVQKRLDVWGWWFSFHKNLQIILGCTSLAASAFAAINLTSGSCCLSLSQCAAVYSTIAIGVMGFVQPGKQYGKFVAAWRVLDAAVDKYRYGLLSIEKLLEAKELGEHIIGGYEREEATPKEPPELIPHK